MAAVTGVMIVTTLLMVIDLLTRSLAAVASAAEPATETASERDTPTEADRVLEALAAEAARQVVTPAQREALQAEAEQLRTLLVELERETIVYRSETERLQREQIQQAANAKAMAEAIAETQLRIDIARANPRVTMLEGDAAGKPVWWVRLAGNRVTAAPLSRPGEQLDIVAPSEWNDLAGFLADAETIDPAVRAWVLLVDPAGVDQFHRAQEQLRQRGFDVGWDLASADENIDGTGSP